MKLYKIIALFLGVFLLFYLEPVTVAGGITFSQVWKIPLFLFLLYNVIIFKKIKKPVMINISLIRAVKNFFNGGMFSTPFIEIIDFIRYMMFPLLFLYIRKKVQHLDLINFLLLSYAQFVILSGIPFYLGFLKSISKELTLEGEFNSYIGVFQNPHSASITTSVSLLVIIGLLKNKTEVIKYAYFNYALLVVGIVLLYATYVRTGYAMFLIGIFILYFPNKISAKQLFTTAAVLAFIGFGIYYLLSTNEMFYNRIFDIRNDKETEVGSGRLIFWETSFQLWMNGDIWQVLFGYGIEALKDRINEVTGIRVYAHNEFFTQLSQNGLIGVGLFISYLIYLFKFIIKRREAHSFQLVLGIYFLFISLMMTQGGVWFPLEVFMALTLVRMDLEIDENEEEEDEEEIIYC